MSDDEPDIPASLSEYQGCEVTGTALDANSFRNEFSRDSHNGMTMRDTTSHIRLRSPRSLGLASQRGYGLASAFLVLGGKAPQTPRG
jgi:hypothetical protein